MKIYGLFSAKDHTLISSALRAHFLDLWVILLVQTTFSILNHFAPTCEAFTLLPPPSTCSRSLLLPFVLTSHQENWKIVKKTFRRFWRVHAAKDEEGLPSRGERNYESIFDNFSQWWTACRNRLWINFSIRSESRLGAFICCMTRWIFGTACNQFAQQLTSIFPFSRSKIFCVSHDESKYQNSVIVKKFVVLSSRKLRSLRELSVSITHLHLFKLQTITRWIVARTVRHDFHIEMIFLITAKSL